MARPIRDRLTTAAERLKAAGFEDSAADIKAVLAPGGWTLLRSEPGTAAAASNLAITTNKGLKDALVAAAAEFCVSLSSVADDGLRAVVEGSWLPPRVAVDRTQDARIRKAKTKTRANERTVLNLRVQDKLRTPVQNLLPELTKTAGYRVALGNIVLSWLADELGVERPNAQDAKSILIVMPRPFRDHVIQASDAQGVSLQDVLEEGIRSLLSGAWRPEIPWWVIVDNRPRREDGKWDVDPSYVAQDPLERSKMSVLIDRELLAEFRERAELLSEDSGYPYHPGNIATQILKDRFGEPE